jgi:spore coat protein U-like protein
LTPYSLFPSSACSLLIYLPFSFAATCTVNVKGGVNFDSYNVASTTPNESNGELEINCTGTTTATGHSVALSSGMANSFAERHMHNGSSTLRYNLYTSPDRSVVWGDGTGGTAPVAVNGACDPFCKINIFGTIPPGQNAKPGTYTDIITTTITY